MSAQRVPFVPPNVMRRLQTGATASVQDVCVPPPEFSDDALAQRWSDQHANDWRYTALWGRWSQWDGSKWRQDSTLQVYDLVRRVCRAEAAKCASERVAAKITSAATIAAVERLARSDPRHASTVDQWDADHWILNTPGGTVDLRTGELRPSNRLDYCTKSTCVTPANGARPIWEAFLSRVLDGDQQLADFMRRTCGYFLTGSTREHAAFFAHGGGGNGKTAFTSTVSGILGDYSKTAPVETFVESHGDSHPTDLAGLRGARLVTAVETEEGRRWSESKLKSLTGGDRIAARFMRQDFFEFQPVFKLLVVGNHKPGLKTVDEAIRRRMNLIPFLVTIPASERDSELLERLKSEWPAILAWMVDGCLSWQREGLRQPEAVRLATEQYLEGEDGVGRWLEEACAMDRGSWTSTAALFKSWSLWCERNHEHTGSAKRFSQRLETRGITPERTRTARGFKGIALREDT